MGNQATERYGYAGMQGYDSSGRSPLEKGNLDPSGFCYGVPLSPVRQYKIFPLAASTSNLATSQDPSGAVALTAGTGVTKTTLVIGGNSVAVYDITAQGTSAITTSDVPDKVQRSVTVTGAGTTAFNVTVTGYDMYYQPVACTFQGPATGLTQTNESNKTFSYISTVSVSADPGVNITVGTGDTFGFPVKVAAFDHFTDFYWNNTPINAFTGFSPADDTSPTTNFTGDVRGSYKLQSTFSNGTTALAAYIAIFNPNNMNVAYGIVP